MNKIIHEQEANQFSAIGNEKAVIFAQELKKLLEKHNATLCPIVHGDGGFSSTEQIGVSFKLSENELPTLACRYTSIVTLSDDDNVSSDNIEVASHA
jgi:hypothetical protein